MSLPPQNSTRFSSAGTIALSNVTNAAVDVMIINGHDAGVGDNANALRAFVEAGGGLVIGSHAWYW